MIINHTSYTISIKTLSSLLFVFFGLSLLGAYHHELWLDEAHHWLLARDSTSIGDLISKTRQEGHPILWNVLLFCISKVTSDPIWMQVFHTIMATSAVYVILKYAPFKLWLKVLFIFGYYMLFEYNLISRNYILGVLFLFMACSFYPKRRDKPIYYLGCLALACNTHAMFLIPSCGLVVLWIIELLKSGKLSLREIPITSLLLWIVGFFLALLQIIPPGENYILEAGNQISFSESIAKSFIGFFKGVFQVPDITISHFWNTNLWVNISKPVSGVMGLISLCIPFLLFFKQRLVLVYVYLCIGASFLFLYITQLSASRFHGIFTLIIISGLWIASYHTQKSFLLHRCIPPIILDKTRNVLIVVIFGLQLCSGLFAYVSDIARPFTQARNSISYLKNEGLHHKAIVTKACDGTALSAYLEQPIFFIRQNAYCSYCQWEKSNSVEVLSKEKVLNALNILTREQSESIIFISYDPIFSISDSKWVHDEHLKYRLLQGFENSILNKGNYYLYEVALQP